jgi:hypothetical protein
MGMYCVAAGRSHNRGELGEELSTSTSDIRQVLDAAPGFTVNTEFNR